MTRVEIDDYLIKKLEQNDESVVFTFFELRVKLNLTSEETLNFLYIVSAKLEKKHYKIYRTGQEYTYNGRKTKVEDNQLLIAIKEKEQD